MSVILYRSLLCLILSRFNSQLCCADIPIYWFGCSFMFIRLCLVRSLRFQLMGEFGFSFDFVFAFFSICSRATTHIPIVFLSVKMVRRAKITLRIKIVSHILHNSIPHKYTLTPCRWNGDLLAEDFFSLYLSVFILTTVVIFNSLFDCGGYCCFLSVCAPDEL